MSKRYSKKSFRLMNMMQLFVVAELGIGLFQGLTKLTIELKHLNAGAQSRASLFFIQSVVFRLGSGDLIPSYHMIKIHPLG